LFGDEKQLGPIPMEKDHPVVSKALTRSLFARLVKTNSCPTMTLRKQYRMHPAIAEFSAKKFYANPKTGGDLQNGVTEQQRSSFGCVPWPNKEESCQLPFCHLPATETTPKASWCSVALPW
jgi:superfamily I DNA and/or RNA helicase